VVLTHHPLIFKPLQSVRTDRVIDRLLVRALAEATAVVSCHTNLDKVAGGVNDALADALGITNYRVLVPEDGGSDGIGFGRIGEIAPPVSFAVFIENMLSALDIEAVRVAGPAPEKVATVAVCGGSGSELAEMAFASGAGVFVTGEVKHSSARWAEGAGFCLIDAGHFSTEKIVLPVLAAAVSKIRDQKEWRFEVVCSECQASPFRYFFRK
jgi:dinuclear metal center YbgI/SA1388 family protein